MTTMKTTLLTMIPASLLLFAAAAVAEPAARVFGAAMPEGAAQPIDAAIAAFDAGVSAAQKYSGRVAKVCRKKGCWMELEADGHSARITMLDYGFFVPTDASGAAEVFGTLSVAELDQATADHYAADAGEPAPGVGRQEYRIVAHSVALLSN